MSYFPPLIGYFGAPIIQQLPDYDRVRGHDIITIHFASNQLIIAIAERWDRGNVSPEVIPFKLCPVLSHLNNVK